MSWPIRIRTIIYPEEKRVWARIRILHETDKAILVDNGKRLWVPKSRIKKMRLNGGVIEIYVKEGIIG